MTEISMEERISIRESARALKKYGSTSNNVKRQENFIKHEVLESDTLQGLALKYGVTTEQIRRANRLWANDSLFLRKSLLIPVAGLGPASDVALLEDGRHRAAPNNNNNNNNNNDHDHEGAADSDTSYNDFLVKIDCSIASTKTQVMMSQDNSQFVDNGTVFVRRRSAASRLRQRQTVEEEAAAAVEAAVCGAAAAACGGGSEVPLVVMTQGRRVRNSLQRLEREQDEMFEL